MVDPKKKGNGLSTWFEKCSPTAQALLLLGMFAGGGLSVGLLVDDVMGVPSRVEANTSLILTQDTAHRAIMGQAAQVTGVFRDSILQVQGDILRTLRALVCFEASRMEGRSTVQCGLQQLLPSNNGGN